MYNKKIFRRCFPYPKKYWYKNIKNIPLYFKCIHHLIKNGYDEYATWETFDWFINTMTPILKEYRASHHGVPVVIDDYPYDDYSEDADQKRRENEDKWDFIIEEMILLLADMDENNPKYKNLDFKDLYKYQEDAKNKFFELFSKYFYNLWD